ncbi:lactate utilization protein C [Geobacillus sp. FSL W8-0032]|uniref:Lactate utilization protein C n=1 Tax=Geobacillus icigianus TaxID=1430331 RepID=A0ABU6BK31_9BACL|nr:lactate utilization protein C [Geobacillus icigianus]MEB3752044.1 Lactate utilization protein C [Geobacillus icigianus]
MMRGTIQNRDAFLQTIAERLGRSPRLSGISRPQWDNAPQWTVFAGYSQDDLLAALRQQCTLIHTDYIETTSAELAGVLKRQVSAYGGGPVIVPNDPRFAEYGLSPLLQEEWPAAQTDVHVWNPALGCQNIDAAEQANVGIAFSDITLAESGTVVLFSRNGQGRAIHFLPKTYIAIVPKSTIVPRMTQAAALIHEQIEQGVLVPSCINFITGPSNSADIEMNLVVGVHGPMKAAYIIVTDR